MHERVWLTIIALNKAEALHGVEELDRATGALAGQLTLRPTIRTTATWRGTEPTCTRFARRSTIRNGKRFAFDLEISRGNLAATVNQSEAQRLTLCQSRQASLFYSADVHEHVFAAIVAHDKAKALLAVEELDYAGAFANHLSRHAAAPAASTCAAAAETTAAASTAAAEAITTAKAAAATTEAAATAAESVTTATEATAALFCVSAEILVAETVPLVLAAPAATSIKTHALLVTFASPIELRMNMPDEGTCRIRRKTTVWESV